MWWWRLETEKGLWQDIIKSKYMQDKGIIAVSHKYGDSPIWTDLLKDKNIYLRGRKISTRNGKKTLFWEDTWLGDKPICVAAPVIFDQCAEKGIIVHDFLRKEGQLQFDRWLPPILFNKWLEIICEVYTYKYENCDDIITWKWCGKKQFTTKSVYDHLTKGDNEFHFQHIWKSKVPYEIKIFTWLLENNVVLTKDNMVRRKWTGNPSCMFRNQTETIDHLFFQCKVTRCVWGVIAMCFGTNTIPSNIQQYTIWIHNLIPNGKVFHHFTPMLYVGQHGR